jgi:hypothetical protein
MNTVELLFNSDAFDYESYKTFINSLSDSELREIVLESIVCIFDPDGEELFDV